MSQRGRFNSLVISSLSLLLGCSAAGNSASTVGRVSGGSGAAGTLNLNTDGGSVGSGGSGSIITENMGGATVGSDPTDPRNVPVRQKVCDANGKCTCLRLGLLGTLDSAANNKDTQPFIDWLNGNTDGTATVTMVATKPAVDATFLAQYDILLVANVNSWSFSSDEKAAVEKWVKEGGGGIIALTGFVSTDAETTATSQLIEFAGMGFQAPTTAQNGQSKPVYYKGGTVDLKNCLNWSGSVDALITTPIAFAPQTGSLSKLTLNLNYVGAFMGWTVKAPAEATVVAKDPVSGGTIAAAYEVEGKGRIFAFGDEWVIFKSEWVPIGQPNNMQMDTYNPCWQPAVGNAPGFFQSVQTLYQTKQFWFDAINWVAPPNACNFTVDDPDVVVK